MTRREWPASCGIATLVLLAFVWAVGGQARAAPLSLSQALRLADQESQGLVAGRAEVAASSEDAKAAQQLPDPVLSAGIQNLPFTGADRFNFNRADMTMKTIGLSQQWVGRSKRAARAERAQLRGAVNMAQADADQLGILQEVATNWFALLLAKHEEHLLDQDRHLLTTLIAGAEASVASSTMPAGDAIAARQALLEHDNEHAELDARIGSLKAALFRWTLVADPEPSGTLPDFTMAPADPAQLEVLVQSHAAVLAAAAALRAAQADTAVMRAERHPDWTAKLGFGQRDGDRSQMVSLMFSVPLPINRAARQDRVVEATHSREIAAAAKVEAARRKALAEIRGMWATWQSATDRLRRFDDALVPLARQQADLAAARYGAGTGSLDDAIQADRNQIDVGRERLALLGDLGRAWVSLMLLDADRTRSLFRTNEASQ
ncbi:TolC family protein [Emcibacter sp. SYSU 3D8]|uniref:TolC family protein n=1 Tax=Emcibacter sp. SYSU 3D8 TaxID=3133969 RepID=UPI0031FE9EBE